MTLDDKIYQNVRKLPDTFREELLDFVQYLLMKAERRETLEWSSLSLSSAMRGLEEEESLYGPADLKVIFE